MAQELNKWRSAGIGNSFMFRLVMEKPELCRHLIEIVLDIKIKSLAYLDPEKNLEAKLASKGVRLDIYAEDEDGNIFDIEMQVGIKNKVNLGKRVRYYQSMMDTDTLKKGQLYSRLRKSVIIFICPFDQFGKGLCRYTFSHLCHEDTSVSLNDEAMAVFINVLGDRHRVSRELANLMDYIENGRPIDEYTSKLDQAVQRLRKDDGSEALFMTWEQTILEEKEWAREEGRIEEIKKLIRAGLTNVPALKASGLYTDEELAAIQS